MASRRDDITKRRKQLSPEKRALLEKRLAGHSDSRVAAGRSVDATPPGPANNSNEPHAPDTVVPLSFGQERLWFAEQLDPGAPVYNICFVIELAGDLRSGVLESALSEIVRRHPSLRTVFKERDGLPIKQILPPRGIRLEGVDLTHLDPEERLARAQRYAYAQARKPIPLSRPPLMRTELVRLGDDRHRLLVTMHHIISDGWSVGVFFDELVTLYGRLQGGDGSCSADARAPAFDYATWQRTLLTEEALEPLFAYWQEHLEGVPRPELQSGPRSSVLTTDGDVLSVQLSRDQTTAIRTTARHMRATPFSLLLGVFGMVLSRLTDCDDLAIGIPAANRERPELEGVIGFMVNTLVLRIRLSDDPTFEKLVQRIVKEISDAYASEVPFEKLVERLNPIRDPGRYPIFGIGFGHQELPRPKTSGNVEFTLRPIGNGTAKAELTLFVFEEDKQFSLFAEFNTAFVQHETVEHLLSEYERILSAALNQPDQRVSKLRGSFAAARTRAITTADTAGDELYRKSNLTRNQLLMWLGEQLQPNLPINNLVFTFTIEGPVDRETFGEAFRVLVASTDALRTIITTVDGVPRRDVLAHIPRDVEYMIWPLDTSTETDLGEVLNERSRQPFRMDECLYDSVLVEFGPERYLWYLGQHHITSDSTSVSILFRRMAGIYERLISDSSISGLEFPSFEEFAASERAYNSSDQFVEDQSYWQAKLSTPARTLALYASPLEKKTSRVRRIRCDLGKKRTRGLRDIAAAEPFLFKTQDVSMFNILTALLVCYLHRVSGHARIAIAAPFHNRPSLRSRDTVGFCMQVLPLRIHVEKDDSFATIVDKVRVECTRSLGHIRYTTGNPLGQRAYDIMINYHTASYTAFAGLPVTVSWIHTGYENDSLALQIHDFNRFGSLAVDFDLHRDVFDAECREHVIPHFLRVVDAFIEDPVRPIGSFSLLTEAESVAVSTNSAARDGGKYKNETLVAMIEAQSENHPQRPAVCFEGAWMNYEELNSRANQIAQHLKSHAVDAGAIVATYLEADLDLPSVLLGILKTGAAFLSFDTEYPSERIAFMIDDAKVAAVVTRNRLRNGLPESAATLVDLADVCDVLETPKPVSAVAFDTPAYVIYTSGTMGRPKAAVVDHSAICNRVGWARDAYGWTADTRFLQKASLAYDAAVWEIFEPLCAGAQLMIAKPGGRRDVPYLLRFMAENHVNVFECTPSLLAELLEGDAIRQCHDLQFVFSGGEVLSARLCERFADKVNAGRGAAHSQGTVSLINTYGPTETAIDVTHWVCDDTPTQLTAPIGRPIDGVIARVLDSYGQPVPDGVCGELYIAGAAVGRGYLNQPELTETTFVADPDGNRAGARMYKTGDLVRRRNDGVIEFVGRSDHQIKLRGFRIELGEIEAVIRESQQVRDAVVTVHELSPGDVRLAGYVVAPDHGDVDVAALREFLRARLPGHMIPSSFTLLDRLPLTISGKVDRRELPAPDRTKMDTGTAFVSPRSEMERTVAAVWREVLHVERIGVDDNFFDLGGHSLLLLKVHNRLRAIVGAGIAVVDLFRYPSVGALAQHLSGTTPKQAASEDRAALRRGALARRRRDNEAGGRNE